tara:strand:+ start:11291 stop:11476 length:186 start_codon:yes stop_codon:yes gene_type:complete
VSTFNNDDLMDKLRELQTQIDNIETKVESLDDKLQKHIKFIDKTYEGLRNPIATATKFFRR